MFYLNATVFRIHRRPLCNHDLAGSTYTYTVFTTLLIVIIDRLVYFIIFFSASCVIVNFIKHFLNLTTAIISNFKWSSRQ